MKKLIFIIPSIIILIFGAWFLFGREEKTLPNEKIGGELPFGSSNGVNSPALDSGTVGEIAPLSENASESSMFKISSAPTAGFTIMTKGSDTWVRYADRGTGHIYDALLPKEGAEGAFERIKRTNNTLPKIHEAVFRADGGAVLLRSLEKGSDIVNNITLTFTVPPASSTDALYSVVATNIRGNLSSAVPGIGNALLYVLNDNSSITSSTFTGSDTRTLFSSSFDNWRLGKMGNSVLAYTKASYTAPGYAYSLPSLGGSLTKLAGPLNGLVATANSNGTQILYSYSEGNSTKLAVKNVQKGTTSEILPASLAEKCVWSSKNADLFYCGTPLVGLNGNEPDNWYLGRTHYTDYIWRYDTKTETARLVAEPKTDFGIDIDVYQPAISPNEDFMVFINKRDLTLWAIRLN